jgi:hypothetical protein
MDDKEYEACKAETIKEIEAARAEFDRAMETGDFDTLCAAGLDPAMAEALKALKTLASSEHGDGLEKPKARSRL